MKLALVFSLLLLVQLVWTLSQEDEKACVLGHIVRLLVKYMDDPLKRKHPKDISAHPKDTSTPARNRTQKTQKQDPFASSVNLDDLFNVDQQPVTECTSDCSAKLQHKRGRKGQRVSSEEDEDEEQDSKELLCIAHMRNDAEWTRFLNKVLTK